jgi:hypothetical protein
MVDIVKDEALEKWHREEPAPWSVKEKLKAMVATCKKLGNGEPWTSLVEQLIEENEKLEKEIEGLRWVYECPPK